MNVNEKINLRSYYPPAFAECVDNSIRFRVPYEWHFHEHQMIQYRYRGRDRYFSFCSKF